jgi:hypothetical protein
MKSFLTLMETYRKIHRISLVEWTDGIMSLSSYYRYIKGIKAITLDDVLKLIKKTPYTEQEVFHYLNDQETKSERDITHFTYCYFQYDHVRLKKYYDIIKEKMETRDIRHEKDQFIQTLFYKYQLEINAISLETFILKLKACDLSLDKVSPYRYETLAIMATFRRYGLPVEKSFSYLVKHLTDEAYLYEGIVVIEAAKDLLYDVTLQTLKKHQTLFLIYVDFLMKLIKHNVIHIGYRVIVYEVMIMKAYLIKDQVLLEEMIIRYLHTLHILFPLEIQDTYIKRIERIVPISLKDIEKSSMLLYTK